MVAISAGRVPRAGGRGRRGTEPRCHPGGPPGRLVGHRLLLVVRHQERDDRRRRARHHERRDRRPDSRPAQPGHASPLPVRGSGPQLPPHRLGGRRRDPAVGAPRRDQRRAQSQRCVPHRSPRRRHRIDRASRGRRPRARVASVHGARRARRSAVATHSSRRSRPRASAAACTTRGPSTTTTATGSTHRVITATRLRPSGSPERSCRCRCTQSSARVTSPPSFQPFGRSWDAETRHRRRRNHGREPRQDRCAAPRRRGHPRGRPRPRPRCQARPPLRGPRSH